MKKLSYLNKLSLGLIAIFAIYSCVPNPLDALDQVGPDICPSTEFSFVASDLKLDVLDGATVKDISLAGNTVDFSKGGLHIKAQFGETVQWELKISNDKKQKSYSGKSDSVDIYWYGQGEKFDGTNMQFGAGEVSVEFEIVCMDVITKKFDVTGTQKFDNINSNFGVLIRDWDQNGEYAVAGSSFTVQDGWAGSGSGANPWTFDYRAPTPSPAGGLYCEFYGVTAAPSWYLGATSFPIGGIEALLPTTNTDELYLNFFVKAGTDIENAGSQAGFQVGSTNYLITEDITWDGWKLISHKMSDYLSNTGDPLSTTVLSNIILQLGAQPIQASELKVMYDFLLITSGGPLFTE